MQKKRVGLFFVLALTVYYVFDVYIGWLIWRFPIEIVLPALYFPMLAVNMLGVYVYHLIGNDFLGVAKAQDWILLETEGVKWPILRGFLRQRKWLSFVVLSVFACPLAGYYFVSGQKLQKTFMVILFFLGIACIPCTLVWGGGLSLLYAFIVKMFV
jgi:hypothetical protein